MDKNKESIYGTQSSGLPLQSWGVTTKKDSRIYLHVFDWPADGKLYLGGLRSSVSKAYLLTDPSKVFKLQTIGSKDLLIELPQRAPDSINTVIVLQTSGPIQTDSVRFIAPNTSVNRLLAYDAAQEGKGFEFADGKKDHYYVEGWKSKYQSLSWDFRTIKDQDYRIRIKYLAPAPGSGGVRENRARDPDAARELTFASGRVRFVALTSSSARAARPFEKEAWAPAWRASPAWARRSWVRRSPDWPGRTASRCRR